MPLPLTAGPVGIALQSGALASVLLAFARAHAIGVSTVASLGNEAMITTADMLDYLVADEQTKVICMFLEEIGDPAAFSAAAQRADAAGKPIVALKAGASQAGQQAALAHTGAVAGDDAVVDAALRQLNIIRVASVEELLTTAATARLRPAPGGPADGRADRVGRSVRHHRRPASAQASRSRRSRPRRPRRSRRSCRRSPPPAIRWT